MKPDWKDAPSWAKWLAMDENGDWLWYEDRPVCGVACWGSRGRFEDAESYIPWTDTLEARP